MEIRNELMKYLEAGNSVEDIRAMLDKELCNANAEHTQKTKEYRKLELAKAVAEAVNTYVREVYPEYSTDEMLDAREVVQLCDSIMGAAKAIPEYLMRGKRIAQAGVRKAKDADDVIREWLASL